MGGHQFASPTNYRVLLPGEPHFENTAIVSGGSLNRPVGWGRLSLKAGQCMCWQRMDSVQDSLEWQLLKCPHLLNKVLIVP